MIPEGIIPNSGESDRNFTSTMKLKLRYTRAIMGYYLKQEENLMDKSIKWKLGLSKDNYMGSSVFGVKDKKFEVADEGLGFAKKYAYHFGGPILRITLHLGLSGASPYVWKWIISLAVGYTPKT